MALKSHVVRLAAVAAIGLLSPGFDGIRAADASQPAAPAPLAERLSGHGIDIGLAQTGDALRNASGGLGRATTLSGLLELSAAIDVETAVGIRGGSAYVMVAATFGDPIGDYTGTLHAPSNLAAEDAVRLLEAWYEQSYFDGRFAVLLGKYGVDSEFDAKGTADVFVNGGFGTGLDLSETGLNGPSIFAVTGVGVRARLAVSDRLQFKIALVDGVPGDPDDPTADDIDLSAEQGALLIGELDYVVPGFQFFRLGLGGWAYTTDFEDLDETTGIGSLVERESTGGFYGFAEGILFSEADDANQGLSAFMRIGFADQDVNQVAQLYKAGLVYTGLLPGRPDDVLGFGISTAVNGNSFKVAKGLAGVEVTDTETLAELTYRAPVAKWLTLQPVVQLTRNPGSDPELDDSVLVGLRVGIAF
jgi:porin